jgi:putative transcriptional regulator
MNINVGTILSSTSSLPDDPFYNAIVFVTEHNQDGAIGFVINKKSDRVLNQLVEFKDCIPFPLYFGGPVDSEHLFFIHRCPHLIEDSTPIASGIYLGGNFKQALSLLNSNTINQNNIKIFIGYCGWDFNQLEEEMEEDGWQLKEQSAKSVFND